MRRRPRRNSLWRKIGNRMCPERQEKKEINCNYSNLGGCFSNLCNPPDDYILKHGLPNVNSNFEGFLNLFGKDNKSY